MRLFKKIDIHQDQKQLNRWKIWLLIAIFIIGVGLRLIALGDVFIWNDETDNFDKQVYDHMSTSLRKYIAAEAQELTLGPAWSLIIALMCKLFGGTVLVGRLPSLFFGSAAILAIFYLTYCLFQTKDDKKPFVPAIFASGLTAVCIVQMEFSQRIIPYSSVPFLATGIIIAHMKIINIIKKRVLKIKELAIWSILYAVICGFSVYMHLSITMII